MGFEKNLGPQDPAKNRNAAALRIEPRSFANRAQVYFGINRETVRIEKAERDLKNNPGPQVPAKNRTAAAFPMEPRSFENRAPSLFE